MPNIVDTRCELLRALIVQADLVMLDESLQEHDQSAERFLLRIRQLLVCLDNFRELLERTSRATGQNGKIVEARRRIMPRLKQMSYLRNRIGGHIDDTVLSLVVADRPGLFVKGISLETQALGAAVGLLDNAINSKTDDAGIPTLFTDFFDFWFPGDRVRLAHLLEALVEEAMALTSDLVEELQKQVPALTVDELRTQYMQMALGTPQERTHAAEGSAIGSCGSFGDEVPD
jgi:hypothetical protein